MSEEQPIIIYHVSLEQLNFRLVGIRYSSHSKDAEYTSSRFPLLDLPRNVSIDLAGRNYAGLVDAKTFYAGDVYFSSPSNRIREKIPTFCIEGTPIVRVE